MKYAEDLAKEYDFASVEEYYQYIVDSLINSQRQLVRKLFNAMHPHSKEEFLINFLDNNQGYDISCRNICISELCK